MILKLQKRPNGSVIFCDDIRSEVGNKLSFMGVYSLSMALPAGTTFPVSLPKLGVAITWNEPIDDYPEEVTFKVIFVALDAPPHSEDGTTLAEINYNVKQGFENNPVPAHCDGENREASHRQMTAIAILAPFVIQHPGKVRVRAYRKGEAWGVAALRIEMEEPVS